MILRAPSTTLHRACGRTSRRCGCQHSRSHPPNVRFIRRSRRIRRDRLVAQRERITEAFPIQAATIPDALAGRDICGRAPTGSGKTIAFGIPLISRVQHAAPKKPHALVLVPTRELAAQVTSELRILAGPDGPTVESVYGGVGFDKQIKALRRGVDVVVACPGRLSDLIQQNHLRLDRVQIVVLDEADRMADMGFLPVVKRLLDATPSDRQTLLFSATLDGAVDTLIKRYQNNPSRHEEAGDKRDGERAEHYFWKADKTERVALAAQIIDRIGSTIVFCRTKRGADRVARQLEGFGVTAAAIHGDRSQGQRERALKSFHDGRVQALVATDVAARGIHVDNVAGVIHFDPPADHKDYVHRSGRTARAGNEGVVVSLVVPELRSAVATLQRQLKLPVGVHAADTSKLAEGAPRPVRAEQPVRSHEHNAERARGDRNPGPKKSRNRNRNGAAVRSNGNGSHNGNSNGRSSNGSSSNGNGSNGSDGTRIEWRRPPAFHDLQAVERPGQSPSPEPSGGQGLLTDSAAERSRSAHPSGGPGAIVASEGDSAHDQPRPRRVRTGPARSADPAQPDHQGRHVRGHDATARGDR